MTINTKDLNLLLQEASALNNKKNWTKQDERRNAYLLSAISAVKNGASLADIDQQRLNEDELAQGLRLTRLHRDTVTAEQRADARIWQKFCRDGKIEQRDEVVGNGSPQYLQGNMGSFVPRAFLASVKASMKWYDPIFDPDVVTYVETDHGRPMQVPFMSDTESVAAVVTAEASDQSSHEQDIASTSEVDVAAFTYRTPMWRLSLEAMQDVDQTISVIDLFQAFSSNRIARGVGKDLTMGSGVGKPLGLVPSLVALGTEGVGAQANGSSENDGIGTNTGANSIGSRDIADLYYSVDQAYRQAPKAAFLMNDKTRNSLAGIVSKNGLPLVQWQGEEAFIYGKPVITSPSMDDIEGPAYPVAFGDLSYWCTRHASGGDQVRVFKEAVGLVERGEFGLRTYCRYDGALLYSSANGTCPIKLLRTSHS